MSHLSLIVDTRIEEAWLMTKVEVFDPPMFCSTGVCGPDVDLTLARFATDLRWLSTEGVQVERYNLSQQPHAFAANSVVKSLLEKEGNQCLPLILADGRVLLVTIPEATPVHDAARLQADLQRAGITPEAWVINQSLSANGFSDPLLAERAPREAPFIAEVHQTLAKQVAVVPWTAAEPVGIDGLRARVRLTADETLAREVPAP